MPPKVKNLSLRTPRRDDPDAVTETGLKMSNAKDLKTVGIELAEKHEAVRKLTAYMAKLHDGKGLAKGEVLVWNVALADGIDTNYLNDQSLAAFNDELVRSLRDLSLNFDSTKKSEAAKDEARENLTGGWKPVYVGPNLRALLEENASSFAGMPSLRKHNLVSRAALQSFLPAAAKRDDLNVGNSGSLIDVSKSPRWLKALQAPALKSITGYDAKGNAIREMTDNVSTLADLKADDDHAGNPTFKRVTTPAVKAAPTKGRVAQDAITKDVRRFDGTVFDLTNYLKIISDNTLSLDELAALENPNAAQKAALKYVLGADGQLTEAAKDDLRATHDAIKPKEE